MRPSVVRRCLVGGDTSFVQQSHTCSYSFSCCCCCCIVSVVGYHGNDSIRFKISFDSREKSVLPTLVLFFNKHRYCLRVSAAATARAHCDVTAALRPLLAVLQLLVYIGCSLMASSIFVIAAAFRFPLGRLAGDMLARSSARRSIQDLFAVGATHSPAKFV